MITLFGNEKKEPTLLERLKQSVTKTRTELAARVEQLLTGDRPVDPELLRQLETALLSADIGTRTTREVITAMRQQVTEHKLEGSAALKKALKDQIRAILVGPAAHSNGNAAAAAAAPAPRVMFVVGVNGTGKTTTIGKLANRLKREGASVMLCAADTFRAAAIEQLEVWGQRSGVEVIKQKSGADPSAVIFDALSAARARSADLVIVDTAGRLHTKSNLMAELDKMKRTASKVVPGAPHDVLLVLDATTGQNGLNQAREFWNTAGVTGIVLTKLDGTAKGGIVVAIARELNLPIRYVGTGEQIDDLVPFDAQTYVDSLFD
ncbi:MAG TPA: signal recognition particle-docking protein FtsY [Candidatus Aquilonibacter sp.]|nr:signal recognition particle-docking protein FtsY [Candidatus Aquilonibacter sp.]